MRVTLRPAVEDDYDFLYGVQEAAMRPHVEKAYGAWDDDLARERFRQRFNPSAIRVIQVDEADAGLLEIDERAEEIFLARLYLLPQYQNRGAGTHLLAEIIARSEAQGKPVALRVLKANLGARSLYQRLGFGVTGENDTHYIMARYPKKGYN